MLYFQRHWRKLKEPTGLIFTWMNKTSAPNLVAELVFLYFTRPENLSNRKIRPVDIISGSYKMSCCSKLEFYSSSGFYEAVKSLD